MPRAAAERPSLSDGLTSELETRQLATGSFFAAEADRIARLAAELAERFLAGGRLLALAWSPQARSDARHVSVEFVHPVIVGKRALPALALGPEGGDLADQTRLLASAADTLMVFEHDSQTASAVRIGAALGCLTIGFGADAAWRFDVACADPCIRQEVAETTYHVLWELVHVFLESSGDSTAEQRGEAASAFLYPFLAGAPATAPEGAALLADVTASVMLKASEIESLRRQTFMRNSAVIEAAAATLASVITAGRTVLACGNGGSATDAADLVADLRSGMAGTATPALDLSEDSGVLTALANDVGPEVLFARQVSAHGVAGDLFVAFSTSGDSRNIIAGLRTARERGLRTIAFLGYDGGRVSREQLADHVIVAPSEYVPRIQEAHASVSHSLLRLAGGITSRA